MWLCQGYCQSIGCKLLFVLRATSTILENCKSNYLLFFVNYLPFWRFFLFVKRGDFFDIWTARHYWMALVRLSWNSKTNWQICSTTAAINCRGALLLLLNKLEEKTRKLKQSIPVNDSFSLFQLETHKKIELKLHSVNNGIRMVINIGINDNFHVRVFASRSIFKCWSISRMLRQYKDKDLYNEWVNA